MEVKRAESKVRKLVYAELDEARHNENNHLRSVCDRDLDDNSPARLQ